MKVRRRNHPLSRTKLAGAKESRTHAPRMRVNGPVKPALYTTHGEVADPRPRRERKAV
jgi:hypothetical protein